MTLTFVIRGRLPPKEAKPRAALSSRVARKQRKLVVKVDLLLEGILRTTCLVIWLGTIGGQSRMAVYD